MTEEVECDLRDKFGDGMSKLQGSKLKLDNEQAQNFGQTISRKNSPTFFK